MKKYRILTLCLCIVTGGFYAMEHDIDAIIKKGFKDEDSSHSDTNLDKQVTLTSKYAILMEQQSGEILFRKHDKEKMHPASMTKIMTVYLAIQHVQDLNEMITISPDIFPYLEQENASMAGFLPYQKVSIKDLLYGALLSSGAEACETLAMQISGSEDDFVKLMNKEAKRIGMTDTHFSNCTGLDEDDHVSSVYDIGLLLREALKDDTFSTIFQTKSYYTQPSVEYPDGFIMTSTMWQTMEQHDISSPYLMGGKTGYTLDAGLCLASQGTVQGKYYLFISANAKGDATTKPYHILDAKHMYETLANQR